jgi:hypothetical protein
MWSTDVQTFLDKCEFCSATKFDLAIIESCRNWLLPHCISVSYAAEELRKGENIQETVKGWERERANERQREGRREEKRNNFILTYGQ